MTTTLETPKNRCSICNIKTGLNYFDCKCDSSKKFCKNHRFPFEHNCLIDNKKINEQKLKDFNPVVKTIKLERI